jgi:hypothetical protein
VDNVEDQDRKRDEKRLRAAGWRQCWADYWQDPKDQVILKRCDAVKMLGPWEGEPDGNKAD